MNPPTKVSVIIPTRERADVFLYALLTAVAQDYDNLEIIVSDNFSQDETSEICCECGDPRVRYLNTGRRISMSDNWEFALEHVSEGWVTIIGDDDGLLPGAVARIAEIAAIPGAEAFRAVPCTYSWPQVISRSYGRLNVPTTCGEEIRESSVWLQRVLEGRVSIAELPMLYNGGAVDVSVMRRIKKKTGRFFSSCIPDVYSAIAIASEARCYFFSFEPFAINGASKHSNGHSFARGEMRTKGSPFQKFTSEANIPTHPELRVEGAPEPLPSLHLYVYEAYLQSAALRDVLGSVRLPDQMTLILATAGGFRPVMQEWAVKLAKRHDLDVSAIGRQADQLSRRISASARLRQVLRFLDTYFAGSPHNPIVNVFEASQMAAKIRAAQPKWLLKLGSLLRRAMLRLL